MRDLEALRSAVRQHGSKMTEFQKNFFNQAWSLTQQVIAEEWGIEPTDKGFGDLNMSATLREKGARHYDGLKEYLKNIGLPIN
ncbi:MAG: hypothetical protein ABH846_03745 [Patescibacteria group bacterium]